MSTRRQFFRDCGVGVGALGLASLLNEGLFADATPAPADDPLAPKQPHFAAKAKNIIYLHMAGAPSTLDLFDYKPKLKRTQRPALPRFVHPGPAVRLHQGQAQAARLAAQVRQVRPIRARRCRTSCRTWRRWPTTSRIVRSMYTDQFNHAPAQLFVHTGSPRLGRPSMGCVAVLRPRHREPQPAELRRPGLRHGRARTAAPRCGAAASCRRSTRACSCGRRAIRCCSCPTPTAWTRPAAGSRSTRSRRSTSSSSTTVGDPEIAHAHRAVRDGLPDADQRAGGDGHRQGDEADPRDVRHQARAEGVRQQLPAGPPAGRERRALRAALPLGLGQPRRVDRPTTCATAWSTAARRRTSRSRP